MLSAAGLCVSSIIPALQGILAQSPASTPIEPVPSTPGATPTGHEIKLVSIISSVSEDMVETRWGLHPQFQRDLRPGETQELSRLLNRVTRILGERYAAVAFSPPWSQDPSPRDS